MDYRETMKNTLENIDMLHKDEEYEAYIGRGEIVIVFQTPDDALRISAEIMAEMSEYLSSEVVEDLVFTLYMKKMRFSISGF